jgi:hypothetical protein
MLNCCGAYYIGNQQTGRIYIGSTDVSFRQRFRGHIQMLESGRHHAATLQLHWAMFGPSAFVFRPALISNGDRRFHDAYPDYVPPSFYEFVMSNVFVEKHGTARLYSQHPAGRRRVYSRHTSEVAVDSADMWLNGTTPHFWWSNDHVMHASMPLIESFLV